MFQYHCLNPIAGVGLANFNENYQQTESLEGADAVLVRSAAMHGMELPKSLLAVAITRERIRQIEAKALRKLRHPSRSKKLKDFLN